MNDVEERALAALAPMQSTLSSDGYALAVAQREGGVLEVSIEALEGACADCLVPESVMVPIIERLLADNALPVSGVRVLYPPDSLAH